MFGRLAALIVAAGIVACLLLAARHQRLRAVGEMAKVQARFAEHQRTLQRLRVEIATRTTLERVKQLAARLGPLEPLLPGEPVPAAAPIPHVEFVSDGLQPPAPAPEPLP